MNDNELCTAGILLEQRLGIGVKNLQDSTSEIKLACNDIVSTLQDIRNANTEFHTRLKTIEHQVESNSIKTIKLSQKFEGHIGKHEGLEEAGMLAGRKYGTFYGLVGAATAITMSLLSLWQYLPLR